MTNENEGVPRDAGATKPVQTLFSAVSSCKLRLVRLLIEGGIDVDTRNNQSQTPLLATCSSLEKSHFRDETREKVVKYLIAAGADVNVQDYAGRTPLIYAIITEARSRVIFYLIEAGANLWLEDENRNCAIDYAVQRQDLSQVGVIVEAYKACYSHLHGDTGNFSQKLQNVFTRAKKLSTGCPEKRFHDTRKFPRKLLHIGKEEYHSQSGNTSTKVNITSTSSGSPNMSPQLSEERQLCNLCKNVIFENTVPNAAKEPSVENKSSEFLDLDFSAYDLSAFLYRRRSTGSLFGLSEQRCETIRRKRNLGITLEDLFSSMEINQPEADGQSLFVKNPKTNTMVDISSKGLSVPDINRARSLSVTLPPTEDKSHGKRFLGDQSFSSSEDQGPLFLGHELLSGSAAVGAAFSRHFPPSAIYLRPKGAPMYLSDSHIFRNQDSDEDWDDIVVIPSSHDEMAYRKNTCVSSQGDMTPPQAERPPSSGGTGRSDSWESNSSGSSIPRIVLTDFVNAKQDSSFQDNKQETG